MYLMTSFEMLTQENKNKQKEQPRNFFKTASRLQRKKYIEGNTFFHVIQTSHSHYGQTSTLLSFYTCDWGTFIQSSVYGRIVTSPSHTFSMTIEYQLSKHQQWRKRRKQNSYSLWRLHTLKTMWTSLKKCIVAANISLPTAGLGRDPTLKINIWFSALVVCQLVGHFLQTSVKYLSDQSLIFK